MELNEVIDKRRSIRKYINKKISKEVVECLIDNARLAPSAKNRQPWNFVVVQDTIKNKIADMMIKKENELLQTTDRKGSSVINTANIIKEAPVLILILKEHDQDWIIGDCLSIGAAIEHICLTATDLGLYKDFMSNLTDNINELCVLQRKQIIHPVAFDNPDIRKQEKCFWGNMTKVPITRLDYEDDLFPTAISMISELLRKDNNYNKNRKAEDKIHVTCRGEAILLAATLKAKGYSARTRSGFAPYIKYDGVAYDHWITEYFDEVKNRWVLVDADEHCPDHEMGFDLNDIPRDKFIFGAEAYLGMRNNKYKTEEIYYASDPATLGLKASLRGLFYDFHSLMNDEIIFLHLPKYIQDKKFELTEEEYNELDKLATLMLEPDENFDKLLQIWNNEPKYRIMSGALNG